MISIFIKGLNRAKVALKYSRSTKKTGTNDRKFKSC